MSFQIRPCRVCRKEDKMILLVQGPHIGMYCPNCKAWNGWVSKKQLRGSVLPTRTYTQEVTGQA